MKITFVLTDDSGNVFEGGADLVPVPKRSVSQAHISESKRLKDINPSFELNPLAFMNKYARGLKGPQKFTLLLARLTTGSTTKEMSFREVKKQWNRMKSVMGGEFNPAHANRAKAKGWVDAPKHGVYALSDPWKECLAKK